MQQGRVFIAPYDDPYTIAGQGTVGTEILRQINTQDLANLHAIFVPVGGGGLIAGIAAYVKALYPQVCSCLLQLLIVSLVMPCARSTRRTWPICTPSSCLWVEAA